MSVATTIYIQSATWNGLTFNSTNGGPIVGEYEHGGEPLEGRTADNEYAPFLAVINKRFVVRLRVREVKQAAALGTMSNLTITLTGKAAAVTITCANMVLIAVKPGEQGRAAQGSALLVFQHQSADGTTVPIA